MNYTRMAKWYSRYVVWLGSLYGDAVQTAQQQNPTYLARIPLKHDRKTRALPGLAFNLNRSIMRVDNALHNR